MKGKIGLMMLLILAFQDLKSQELKTATPLLNEKGSCIISLDMAYTVDIKSSDRWEGFGAGISFTYSVLNRLNIGVEPFMAWVKSITYSGQPHDTAWPYHATGPPYSYYKKESFIVLDFKAEYCWINKPKVALYSGVDVGIYAAGTDSLVDNTDYGTSSYYSNLTPGHYYHTGINKYTLVGVKARLSSHCLLISEIGWGLRGFFNLGFGYKI